MGPTSDHLLMLPSVCKSSITAAPQISSGVHIIICLFLVLLPHVLSAKPPTMAAAVRANNNTHKSCHFRNTQNLLQQQFKSDFSIFCLWYENSDKSSCLFMKCSQKKSPQKSLPVTEFTKQNCSRWSLSACVWTGCSSTSMRGLLGFSPLEWGCSCFLTLLYRTVWDIRPGFRIQ